MKEVVISPQGVKKLQDDLSQAKANIIANAAVVDKLTSEMAIVVNGNKTTTGASTNDYVIVKNSSINGVSDGLYLANKSIPANTTLDSSYFKTDSALAKGAINALNDNITNKMLACNQHHMYAYTLGSDYTVDASAQNRLLWFWGTWAYTDDTKIVPFFRWLPAGATTINISFVWYYGNGTAKTSGNVDLEVNFISLQ